MEATAGRMSEDTICALVEEKRKQLDDEIAAFKAAKDEEFRIFERELREGRSAYGTKKKGRGDVEMFSAGKKRHRGGGYATSPPTGHDSSSPKAPDAQRSSNSNELKILETHRCLEDQTPQTPTHERELEFQGLFTPSYMPLLDYGGHRPSTQPTPPERPVRISSPGPFPSSPSPSPSPSSPSSHLKPGGSAAPTQPSFTRPALPKLTLPHKAKSSSVPSAQSPPQHPSTPTSRRSGSPASLHSSIRHSSEPRPPKQVKFKFDDIIVLPTASYDRSQESAATMSDTEKQTIKQEVDSDSGIQKGVQQAEVISTQKIYSTSPLSEPSPSRSFNSGNPASKPGPSGLRDTDHQQSSGVEGNGSLDGLGGKWSTIKEKDVVGRGRSSIQDEIAEVIARAEYEETDEDDYDDGGIFDLDETMPELPKLNESGDENRDDDGIAIARQNKETTSPIDMPLISPSSLRGYDLSLVIPTTLGSISDRYGSSLSHTRPTAVVGSAPADLTFGRRRPRNMTPSDRSAIQGTPRADSPPTNRSRDLLGGSGEESASIVWGSMRRRSSAKYDMNDPGDGADLPTKGKRYLYRSGIPIPEGDDDGDDSDNIALSPMASSLPVQIPASPIMGYTDNGDMDSNSYTPKAPSKQSVTPKNIKEARGKQKEAVTSPDSSSPGSNASETFAISTKNEPTATNVFSLSASAQISSVNNPITDQFATATIGGLHRNAFDPDSLGSYSPSATTQSNFIGNPFVGGSYASPTAITMAQDMGEVGSYVGSIDGCSGYDAADNSSYLKLRRGRSGGEPASFGERLMLEDDMKVKKAKEKKVARRVTQP